MNGLLLAITIVLAGGYLMVGLIWHARVQRYVRAKRRLPR